MYRKLFLITCMIVLSLLVSSGTMAQEPTTPEAKRRKLSTRWPSAGRVVQY